MSRDVPRTHHPVTRPRRRGRVLTALTALITLMALVVGAPVLLIEVAGNPLPDHPPTIDETLNLLTSPDNGTLFLRLLAVVAWASWATFVVSVGVEIPATIRRRPSPRLVGLGLQQRLAATLIATIGLMAHAPAVASAATAHPITQPRPPAAVATVPTPPISSDVHQARPVYEVRAGDWLGHVAARYLGDFNRYREIAACNPDLVAADRRFPDHIEATWHIVLPADAQDRGRRPHATGHLVESVPTAPTAPDRPEPTTPQPAEPEIPTSPAPSAPRQPAPGVTAPTPAPATTPNPSPSTTTSATMAASGHSDAPATPSPHPGDGHRSGEDDPMIDQALQIGAPLFGAGLLAALFLTALRRRRRRQEQHRPVGRRLPEPASAKAETQLRAAAQPIAVDRLDHALRALAAALTDRPCQRLPDIVGAWLQTDTVNLLLTTPCPDPPTGWHAHERTWTLPGPVSLPEADGQLAPLPALAAVGSRPGTHLLLDLERLGLLTVTGDRRRSGDLMRYLAAELACNAWSDHAEVTVAGFDATETHQLIAVGGERIEAATSVQAAIDRIRRRAAQVVRSVDHLAAGDPLAGRIADIAADAWMPHLLLVDRPDPDQTAALAALDAELAVTGRGGVAVVATAGRAIGRWSVDLDADGGLTIAFLGLSGEDETTLSAAGLPRGELDTLADLLTRARGVSASRSPGHREDERWPLVPPAAESEPWARGTDAAGSPCDGSGEAPGADGACVRVAPDGQPAVDSTGASVGGGRPSVVGDDETRGSGAGIVALVGPRPGRGSVVTTSGRGRQSDASLEADLLAWREADPRRPRIAILGPVIVQAPGVLPAERLRFYAEIITYLAARGQRGAGSDQFDDALWPQVPVKATTRRVAVARARRWLGEGGDGRPWLPDATAERRYRLREGYLLDWHLFRRLRTRGETRGPAGGGDLRQALGLVRGAPLAGADVAYSVAARNPYAWLPASDIQPHHLAAAVVDTAHRLVGLCLDGGDVGGARWAVERAWLADPDRASDVVWRDLLRVAAAEGNRAELDHLLGALMVARDAEVPEDLDRETYRLLCVLMGERIGVR